MRSHCATILPNTLGYVPYKDYKNIYESPVHPNLLSIHQRVALSLDSVNSLQGVLSSTVRVFTQRPRSHGEYQG
jgi:hypothetical protein